MGPAAATTVRRESIGSACGGLVASRAVSEYIEHYHRERNHQGVGNRLLTPDEQGCDQPTGTRQSSAASGWADCSISTTGALHESAIHFWHTTAIAPAG
jgi:hypothetical protein